MAITVEAGKSIVVIRATRIKQIRTEEVTFLCPVTGLTSFDILLERDLAVEKVLAKCHRCGGMHALDLSGCVNGGG